MNVEEVELKKTEETTGKAAVRPKQTTVDVLTPSPTYAEVVKRALTIQTQNCKVMQPHLLGFVGQVKTSVS